MSGQGGGNHVRLSGRSRKYGREPGQLLGCFCARHPEGGAKRGLSGVSCVRQFVGSVADIIRGSVCALDAAAVAGAGRKTGGMLVCVCMCMCVCMLVRVWMGVECMSMEYSMRERAAMVLVSNDCIK